MVVQKSPNGIILKKKGQLLQHPRGDRLLTNIERRVLHSQWTVW